MNEGRPGGRSGKGTAFQWGSQLHFKGRSEIGCRCLFSSGVHVGTDIEGTSLIVGNNVQINRDVSLDITGGLEIGDDVLISQQVVVYTHSHGFDPRSQPIATYKTIKEGSWIGMRAVIMPNCKVIGKLAVVGAGSIVTADVPENAIVAGNPAKIIGWRQRN